MTNRILKKKIGKGKFLLSARDNFIPSNFFLPLLSYFNEKYSIFNLKGDFHAGCKEMSIHSEICVEKIDFPIKKMEIDEEKLMKAYQSDNVALNGISFGSYKDYNIIAEYYKVFMVNNNFVFPKGLLNQKEIISFFKSISVASFEIFPDGNKSILFITMDSDFEDTVEKYIKVYNENVQINDKRED